jgi:hypothetical protein
MRFSEKTPAFRAKEGGYLKYCHRFTKTIIMANNTRIPLMVYLLVLLLVFTGIGGIYGGYALVTAPDGSKMMMSTEILANSPFRTFLVPGIYYCYSMDCFRC